MCSSVRDFLDLGFCTPTLLYVFMLQNPHNGLAEYSEIFTLGLKSPIGYKYDVRIEVRDPRPRQPLTVFF